MELGYSALTRRERLERIATAERDRRAGRVDVAVAALGEPSEWPARVVLALARLDLAEGEETRRILETGLDVWASEVGLESLDVETAAPEPADPLEEGPDLHGFTEVLSEPIDNDELERAFEEAEAQTDEMVGANDVAARVLLDEPIGFGDLVGDELVPADEDDVQELDSPDDRMGMDAAWVEEPAGSPAPEESDPLGASGATPDAWMDAVAEPVDETQAEPRTSRTAVLATLERWLDNLERNKARRVQ